MTNIVSDLKKELRIALQLSRKNYFNQNPLDAEAHFKLIMQGFSLSTEDLGVSFRIAAYMATAEELSFRNFYQEGWIFPKVYGTQLKWFEYSQQQTLISNRFGIAEAPDSGCLPEFPSDLPVLMFVPCLAVDLFGNRLGYGGGFYDRFLSSYGDKVITVGCVPSGFIESAIPVESHDYPLDFICDGNKFMNCSFNTNN